MSGFDERLSGLEPTDDDFARSPGRTTEERYRLVRAVRALLDGEPTNADLKELAAAGEHVPITKFTVELEAGVDRRRFSGKLSEHPDLSELLKDMKPEHGVGRTTSDRLKRQAKTIEVLQQQLKASRSATAAQVARIQALTRKLESAERRIRRIKEGDEEPAE